MNLETRQFPREPLGFFSPSSGNTETEKGFDKQNERFTKKDSVNN